MALIILSDSGQPTQRLPACDYLGNAVNLACLDLDPTDVHSVLDNSSLMPIVELDDSNKSPITPPGSNKVYWLPGNTRYDNYGTDSTSHDVVSRIGKEMVEEFKTKLDFGVNYSAVGLSAGAQYSYSNSLKSTSTYGAYSFDQKIYGARLDQSKWYKSVNQELLADLEKLPAWSLDDPDTYKAYASFFLKWGTHLVARSYMGNRYQLMVVRDEMSRESMKRFNLQIKAEFGQIIKGGDGNWGTEKEKKDYLDNRKRYCRVRGGNPAENGILGKTPTSGEAFEKWLTKRDAAYEVHLSLQVQRIATFLQNSSDPTHQEAGKKLGPALDYCCNFAVLDGKLAFERTKGNTQPVQWGECKLSPLPGLEINAKMNREWKIDQIMPSHVRIDRSATGSADALVEIL